MRDASLGFGKRFRPLRLIKFFNIVLAPNSYSMARKGIQLGQKLLIHLLARRFETEYRVSDSVVKLYISIYPGEL